MVMLGKNWLKSLKGQPNLIVWDTLLLIPVVLLLLIGFVGLYSTSLPGSLSSSNFLRQAIWLAVSLLIVWLLRWLHPRIYYTQAYRLYVVLILLLLVTYLMPAFSGGKRWLVLGPLSLQPAEFGKILVVFAIARYLTDYQKYLEKFLYALVPLAIALLPAILIVGQPDLGTAIIYLAVVIPMMYWSGISTLHLFIILAPLVSLITGFNFYTFSAWMLVMILVLYFSRAQPRWGAVIFIINILFGTLTPVLWNRLQPYQQRRIVTLLDASADPHGAGYQVLLKGLVKSQQVAVTSVEFEKHLLAQVVCSLGKSFGERSWSITSWQRKREEFVQELKERIFILSGGHEFESFSYERSARSSRPCREAAP